MLAVCAMTEKCYLIFTYLTVFLEGGDVTDELVVSKLYRKKDDEIQQWKAAEFIILLIKVWKMSV